jgi:hypothetical protein
MSDSLGGVSELIITKEKLNLVSTYLGRRGDNWVTENVGIDCTLWRHRST